MMEEKLTGKGMLDGSRGGVAAHPLDPDSLLEELQSVNRLAAVMYEQGYPCTATESLFAALVKQFPQLDEQSIAEVVALVVRTCSNSDGSMHNTGAGLTSLDTVSQAADDKYAWNLPVIIKVFKKSLKELRWSEVIRCLDQPGFNIPNQQAFQTLMTLYKDVTEDPFPVDCIVGSVWKNVTGQLSFLKFATVSPPELFSFEASPNKQPPVEGLHGGKSAVGTPNQAWLSLDLLRVLSEVCDLGYSSAVKAILDYPLKHCPELLLLGIAAISVKWSTLQAELFSSLIPTYLGSHPNSSLVLTHLWRLDKNVLVRYMVEWYSQDATRISRILDICQELRDLSFVLDTTPYPFALELAALAARREYLNLEKWLIDRFQKEGLPFINATLKFLDLKTQTMSDGTPIAPQPGKINLSMETLALFLRVLQQSGDILPPEQATDLKTVQAQAMKLFPAISATISQNSAAELFASDIEAEADHQFHEIYKDERPLEDVVAMLKAFKASPVTREQEVFACMIHNLFDEYRFFPQYPDRELHITARLFGALIHHQLVSSITLGIALRYVLEALRKPPTNSTANMKMFRFGVDALNDFKLDLHQWPQYCTHILQIPHLAELEPQLILYVQQVTQQQQSVTTDPAALPGTNAVQRLMDGPTQLGGPGTLLLPATQATLAATPHLQAGTTAGLLPLAAPNADAQPLGAGLLPGFGHRFGELANGAAAPATLGGLPPSLSGLSFPNLPATLMPTNAVNGPLGAPPLNPSPGSTAAPAPTGQDSNRAADAQSALTGMSAPSAGQPLIPTRAMPGAASGQPGPSLIPTRLMPGPTSAAPGPSLIPTRPMLGPTPNPSGTHPTYATHEGYRSMELNRSETLTNVPAQVAAASLMAPSLASTLSAETLEAAAEKYSKEHKQPPEAISDRVHFIINNLSMTNVEQKAHDLLARIFPEYVDWFVNYMVVKRASQELNFHKLYITLIDKLNDKELYGQMIKTTHQYIKVLLNSDRIKTHTSERSLLKNLGSWLGLMTFAKTKPVLAKDLDLKAIMCEAYERGKMIGVIPFVHRVLEPCKDSKIFRPPNPYITGILSLLLEIYAQENLKLNLKFEIETIFRDFNLELNSLAPSDVLKTCKRDISPMSPDFTYVEPKIEPVAGTAPVAPAMSASAQPPARLSGPAAPISSLPALLIDQRPADLTQSVAGAGATPPSGARTPPGVAPLTQPAVPDTSVSSLIHRIHHLVTINPSLGMLADRLQLKKIVPIAVDRAICEIITPVVERSVTIACMTTYELVMKDFATEPDEQKMRSAAQLMVSSLAGSLALVTCKDPLRVSLTNQLRLMLQSMVGDAAMMDQAVQVVVNDNLELGCTVIEHAATDKAAHDIDKSLQQAYEQRQKARALNQSFYDIALFQQQQSGHRFPAALPEALKPRPAHLQSAQQHVYEDFSRMAKPGALNAAANGNGAAATAQTRSLATDGPVAAGGVAIEAALLEKFTLWLQTANSAANKEATGTVPPETLLPQLQSLVSDLEQMVTQADNPEEVALFLGKKLFKQLYESTNKVQVLLYVSCLEQLNALSNKKLPLEVTNMFMFMEEDRKYQKDIGEALLRAHLFSMPELDAYFSKVIGTGSRGSTVEFVINTVKKLMVQENVLTGADLSNTLEVIARLALRISGGAVLLQLIEQARNAGKGPRITTDIPAIRERSDPAGLKEKVAPLFEEWIRLTVNHTEDKVHTDFVSRVRAEGFLTGGELQDRFLRILTELAINHCLASESTPVGLRVGDAALSLMVVDSLVRLVVCLVAQHSESDLLTRFITMLTLLTKKDADDHPAQFNPRPYLRILAGLVCELCGPEVPDEKAFVCLTAIGRALYSLQPLSVPAFAFAWLQLVAHRSFMPRLLLAPQQQGWPLFETLIVALLKFMEPHLRNAEVHDSVRHLYKGTLRLLLVLLHDFPEFLCEHHFQLCDAIPPSCIQMRNLILSAFPRNMRLPDPFTPNLKVDLLPEISQPPRVLPDVATLLPETLSSQVDACLQSGDAASAAPELVKCLMLPTHEARLCGTSYNVPLINAFILFIGMQSKPDTANPSSPSPPADRNLFLRIIRELDHEGRYLFLNAIANQLRYPNSHTHYYSCVLLFLFSEAGNEVIQEQITRVLLERLIVNRPHPWGLLITFIELIKNPRYKFWSHQFTRCAPEIERLFESVARSCMSGAAKPEEDGPVVQAEGIRA